ncbi:MAG: 5'-3' exonuclease [Solirubrobacteraceae bacterium]
MDAPSLLYRAFFALPSSIENNALLGCVNQVLWAIERHEPRAVVMCFGAEAAVYRKELLPAYHADRPPMPGDLARQWADARAFFEAFGWLVLDHDALEADDLLGSLATIEAEAGDRVVLFTGDRDMFQCVGEHVVVLFPGGKDGPTVIDEAGVRERYGIEPSQVPDFIALRGDPSDGIPGGRGIGEKTAREILRVHGSLEEAIGNATKERPKVAMTLREQGAQLLEFKHMATLVGVPLDRPADRPTAFGPAADAAEARGMGRLADRLRELASSS